MLELNDGSLILSLGVGIAAAIFAFRLIRRESIGSQIWWVYVLWFSALYFGGTAMMTASMGSEQEDVAAAASVLLTIYVFTSCLAAVTFWLFFQLLNWFARTYLPEPTPNKCTGQTDEGHPDPAS